MTQNVLFLQGVGLGAHDEDRRLVESLRNALGDGYDVCYPTIPHEDSPKYEAWKATIAGKLAGLKNDVILVGHSFGGSVLLKYLSEEQSTPPVAGLFLLAAPFLNSDPDWRADEYALPDDFAAKLIPILHIFLYHSRDDDTVPFAHLGMYAAALPQATARVLDHRGHQFDNNLSEVAEDILNIRRFAT